MVLGAAGGALYAAAGGVSAIWDYNRENYMYDREMRQKNEFKVATFRSKQASLWREDVRDLIALTERKMDSYLIVNTLQLAMCVALFTEGRLVPGTPQWLLRFYMCTLGAAFMYLLMSVWLAMHASVVAQTSGVRILTQFVRLPIPTWQQLEAMRTYAASYEKLGRSMLRIPFISRAPAPMTSTSARGDAMQARSESLERSSSPERGGHGYGHDEPSHGHKHSREQKAAGQQAASSSFAACNATAAEASRTVLNREAISGATSSSGPIPDPWDLEQSGTGICELQNRPNASRSHIGIVRGEAMHWQCYDAFARVSMSFGTNQLLYAITYYCIGYVTMEDGAPWPSMCIAAVMGAIAVTIVHMDLSLTRTKLQIAIILLLAGPACAVIATWAIFHHSPNSDLISKLLLPVAYLSHGLWLLWALKALRVERHVGGAWLPMNFRTVLYLDVFGWLHHHHQQPSRHKQQECRTAPCTESPESYAPLPRVDSIASEPFSPKAFQRHQDRLTKDLELWQRDSVQTMMEPQDKERVSKFTQQFHSALDQDSSASTANPLEASAKQSSGGEQTGLARESEGYAPSSPSAIRKQKAQWVRLTGQTDFGTMVPYLYNPDTGDVRTMESAESRSRAMSENSIMSTERTTLSLTQTEEHIESFVRKAEKLKTRQEAQTQSNHSSATPTEDDTGITAAAWSCTAKIEPTSEQRGGSPLPTGSAGAAADSALPTPDSHQSTPDSAVDHFHGPATDYGEMDPGKLPWLVFRFATLLLVGLWATGPLLSFGLLGGVAEFGSAPLMKGDSEEDTSAIDVHRDVSVERIISAAISFGVDGSLPAFSDGEEVRVNWPRNAAFTPRSLSCDPLGKQLVVSDDFGVYSGQLWEVSSQDAHLLRVGQSENAGRERDVRRLRGHGSVDALLAADFSRVLPCTALEGQAVKDIGVVCSQGSPPECRVLVLHSRGSRLAECPLLTPEVDPVRGTVPLQRGLERQKTPARKAKVVEPMREWTISGSWLNLKGKKEHVESIAVNNECLIRARRENTTLERDMSGCVAVGTTSGRVVQMRSHVTEAHQLVPEWNMVQLPHSVGQGSLHVVPGEYVLALHTDASVVRAFDAVKGNVLGTWQLPKAIRWITLCGGGGSIYMLGVEKKAGRRENGQHVRLWRFPAPPELKARGLLTRDYSKAIGAAQEI